MSFSESGNKVYASINDLEESQTIEDGYRIIIQTDNGTMLFDYANLQIDLEHTTFKDTFTATVEYVNTANEFITSISDSFTEVEELVSALNTSVNLLNADIEAIKFIIMLMCTGADDVSLSTGISSLSENAKISYENMFRNITSNSPGGASSAGFTFTENYLYNGS